MKLGLVLIAIVAAKEAKVRLDVMLSSGEISWRAKDVQPGLPCRNVARPLPWYRLGYQGFEIEAEDGNVTCVYDNHEMETALLFSGRGLISDAVFVHVRSEIERLRTAKASDKLAWAADRPHFTPAVRDNCTVPILGPDDATVYDPSHQVCSHWVTHQGENNCYDYGNDIATDTFAQPGRGSGQQWKSNTCTDMRAAAERDGLVWNGTMLPKSEPPTGHYAALLIWPGTNFHWIRFDSQPAGFWSHKPGGTPVRNVDNNGKSITDPSKSDFAPWTQFCGYMSTVPSRVHIN